MDRRESGLPPTAEAYAPPRSSALQAPEHVDRSDIVPAGFVRRWAALFLDKLILSVVLFVLNVFIVSVAIAVRGQGGRPPQVVLVAIGFVVAMLYYALQESSYHQATLGKRALGIKVTDNHGERLGFGRAIARWFAALLSYLVLLVGFLMAAFTERKRALHDMLTGTLVVDRWACTEHPDLQKRNLSAGTIALALTVGLVPMVAVAAVLAAIAIPAYQDYTIRSQISDGAMLADGAKTNVANHYFYQGNYPHDNAEAGIANASEIHTQYVSSLAVTDGLIRISYGNHASPLIAGRQLVFAPHYAGGVIYWSCNSQAGTNIDNKFRPIVCRP